MDKLATDLTGLTPLHTARGFLVSEVAAEARPAWEESALSLGIPLALSDLEIWQKSWRYLSITYLKPSMKISIKTFSNWSTNTG